jgi:uncharacterized membrane protein YphA (DoxX/SURF4 family)
VRREQGRALPEPLEPIDLRLTAWMAGHGVTLTRVALGVVYFWFGAIKLVPGWSPAAELAVRTIARLTGGLVPPDVALPLLAVWEVGIGLGLLSGRFLRLTLLLLFLQLPGTLLPLLYFPRETFSVFPFAPTLEGQYIVKNLVLAAAALVVGATVRGGRLSASPARPAPGRGGD